MSNLEKFNIRIITPTHLNLLLDKYTNNTGYYFEEMGLFLCRDNDTWLAVDNCSESLLIEEFISLDSAVQFLLE
ncbi:hypothetical protein [Nosocomiicoccus ampullae]|uniref:hypothetical protein n=1 Tax=Nosocomiicoccus ampullae TaxID=489910 RepID=UPI002550FD4B|nr:hypothetical protein [Nosocomiicoccus ampullae]MDK6863071.1 hypothetical protein [Nosocomiicoccus ampullae]